MVTDSTVPFLELGFVVTDSTSFLVETVTLFESDDFEDSYLL